MAGAAILPSLLRATSGNPQPSMRFPQQPRERIAIASYPFREYVAGQKDALGGQKIELKDFSAHVAEKFNIRKIEPWSDHFRSLDHNYLEQIRAGVEKAGGMIVNIAVDGEHSPYAADKVRARKVRGLQQAMGGCRRRYRFVRAFVAICLRPADSEPNAQRAADSLSQVVEYAARKNIVVNHGER